METTEISGHVFLVDDEVAVCRSIAQLLETHGHSVTYFTSAASCLDTLNRTCPHLLITDMNMDGIDGFSLLDQAHSIRPFLPILIVTGYGDVPLAVRAVKNGAMDFIEKPIDQDTFLPLVAQGIQRGRRHFTGKQKLLTKTEEKILELIVAGKSNRDMAQILHRSIRTVEDHRNNIMRKMQAGNVVELVKLAIQLKLVDVSQTTPDNAAPTSQS
jgi:two-component system, LuxR family, response regulator FixJ